MKDIELTETTSGVEINSEPEESFQARLEKLETETQNALRQSEQRIVLAELKVEAVRAGMIDLDGLKLLDTTNIHLTDGELVDGAELVGQLKRAKPWLFSVPSSSSTAKVPQSKPARQKMATDMTNDEYRAARAEIIKRSML
jgi:hypothetical protein